MSREVLLSDWHFPSEDKEVTQIMGRLVAAQKPDILWLNGDFCDHRAVSPFGGSLQDLVSWKSSKQAVIDGLRFFREKSPKSKTYFKEGNHDNWIKRYVIKHAPALDEEDSLTLPKLLQLKELDIEFIPETVFKRIGKLLHLHGHELGGGSANPARYIYDRLGTSAIAGHFHRFQYFGKRTLDSTHGVQVIGCGQRMENISYDHFPLWEQGGAVIDYTQSGLFHIEPLIVVYDDKQKCKCIIFERKMYTAKGVSGI